MKVNIPKGNVLCGKCKNFWVRDDNQRDCPYCEIDRLREALERIIVLKDNQSISYEKWELMVEVAVNALNGVGGGE